MIGGRKLAEGAYGCIFYPEIDCEGNETNNKDYVTKLQFRDFNSDNEVKIGEYLKKFFQNHEDEPLENNFAAALTHCNTNISVIKRDVVKQCDVLEKDRFTDNINMVKIRFIDDNNFDKYISNNINSPDIFQIIFSSLNHLYKSLNLLIECNLIHYDLKGNNIIFDTKKNLPIIVDFGLSFILDDVFLNNLHNYFYRYAPDYYIWSIEIHYINLLINKNINPSKKDFLHLATTFTNHNKALDVFSNEFKENYINNIVNVLTEYNKLPTPEEKIKAALEGWTTWDNFAISILYIRIICGLIKTDKDKMLNNIFIKSLLEIMVTNIHPNYKKRMSVPDTIVRFKEIIEIAADKLDNIDTITRNIQDNSETIRKNLLISNKSINKSPAKV